MSRNTIRDKMNINFNLKKKLKKYSYTYVPIILVISCRKKNNDINTNSFIFLKKYFSN